MTRRDDDEGSGDGADVGQEFLFHLYRGSALLEDNQVDEAKHELERALSHQPRDAEGQGLLGVVYFRLGHYPRAIQIFEDLVQSRSEEITPKVNLALCYLKTGQVGEARGLLEDVVTKRPEHLRAWGYLGLAFQRLGDFEKAAVAFERAGKPKLAARLRPSPADHSVGDGGDAVAGDFHELVPADAPRGARSDVPGPSDGDEEPAPRSARAATAPGTDIILPRHVARFLRESHLVFPESPRVVVHRNGTALVRVETAFAFRPDCVVAFSSSGPIVRRPAHRRLSDRELPEPLGGGVHPLTWVEGQATLILTAPHGRHLMGLAVSAEEPLFLREDHLIGLEHTVDHVAGRLPLPSGDSVPIVKVTGSGVVVVSAGEHVMALPVEDGGRVGVRADRAIGWSGRLVPSAEDSSEAGPGIRGLLAFSGQGAVLVETP